MSNETDKPIVNIAGYKFLELGSQEDIDARQERYKSLCEKLDILGFMLISPEGINLSLAGLRESIDAFLKEFRSEETLSDFEVKESFSQERPFGKLRIRRKGHIIPMNREVRPQDGRGKTISAKELNQWIEEKKDFVILDVRNDYEVLEGKFKDSKTIPLHHFRDFADVMESLDDEEIKEMRSKPVVTVCTGGIKTEKATVWMSQNGYSDVRLLDGGILKYLEEYGSKDFEGRCFVFDERHSLDGKLNEPIDPSQRPNDPYFDQKMGRV